MVSSFMKQLLFCPKSVPCAHLATDAAKHFYAKVAVRGVVPAFFVLRHILTAE